MNRQEKLLALRLKHTIRLGLVRVPAFTLLVLAQQQALTTQSAINQESRAKSRCYPFPMPRFHRPFDPRSMELVIFDLDGTLIDSRLDLIHSVNAMLRRFERPELPGEVVASYVGDR